MTTDIPLFDFFAQEAAFQQAVLERVNDLLSERRSSLIASLKPFNVPVSLRTHPYPCVKILFCLDGRSVALTQALDRAGTIKWMANEYYGDGWHVVYWAATGLIAQAEERIIRVSLEAASEEV